MLQLKDKEAILYFIGWFFLINGLLFCVIGYQYLATTLWSPTLFHNFIASCTSGTCKSFIVSFAVINYLQYMLFLAFIPAFLLWVIAFIVPNKVLIWTISILLATLSLLLFFVDKTVFFMFKFHLNSTLLHMLFGEQAYDLFDFSTHELHLFIGISLLAVFFEIFVAYCVWTKLVIERQFRFAPSLLLIWLVAFLFSYFSLIFTIAKANNLLSQQTPNLPFYNQLMAKLIPQKDAADVLYQYSEVHYSQPLFAHSKLNYPLHPMQCKKPANPPNIILVIIDSLRFDSLQKEYMPNLHQFSEKSWRFQNHLSGGNCTQPGLFSIFYSLPTSYWTAVLEQQVPPVFMQLLKEYAYTAKILWSGPMTNPPFDKTFFLGLTDANKDTETTLDIGYNDRRITQHASEFLAKAHKQQPFFLSLLYGAAHGYCRNQSYAQPYQPAVKECVRLGLTNETDPIPYRNRYLNAVHFIDQELAKLFPSIEKEGFLKNSVIIITSDHGQEFNDNKQNYWEHTGNFTDAQVHVPLIIYWPKEASKTLTHKTSHYDIIPTLLQQLFQCKNAISDYSIGQQLTNEQGRLPFILAGSYANLGLIEADRLTTLRTAGPIDITDKHAKPLTDAQPRTENIKKALELMRMYYAK